MKITINPTFELNLDFDHYEIRIRDAVAFATRWRVVYLSDAPETDLRVMAIFKDRGPENVTFEVSRDGPEESFPT